MSDILEAIDDRPDIIARDLKERPCGAAGESLKDKHYIDANKVIQLRKLLKQVIEDRPCWMIPICQQRLVEDAGDYIWMMQGLRGHLSEYEVIRKEDLGYGTS